MLRGFLCGIRRSVRLGSRCLQTQLVVSWLCLMKPTSSLLLTHLFMSSSTRINNNSLISSKVTSWNATSHSQDIGRVLFFYDSTRRNLSVSWTYDTTSYPKENSCSLRHLEWSLKEIDFCHESTVQAWR